MVVSCTNKCFVYFRMTAKCFVVVSHLGLKVNHAFKVTAIHPHYRHPNRLRKLGDVASEFVGV